MRGMRARGFAQIAAVLAVGALALTGCTTDGGDTPSGDGSTITLAEVNELSSFNQNTPAGNVDINGKVATMIRSGFFYPDNNLKLVNDESFGTMEKLSDDPLTVKYTINEGLVWSDGEPIDANDMLLDWAVGSGYFDDATFDPATGEVTGGTQYFTPAGTTSGLDLTAFPEIGDDNRSMTITYSRPYADWNVTQFGQTPSHVVAKLAGITEDELIDLISTAPAGDPAAPAAPNEDLLKVADAFNTGFDTAQLPDDESVYVSSGPMIVSAWDPGQSVTLVKNDKYTGDLEAQVDSIVIRFIGDADAQVTALKNGEVDIIAPQPSADTLASLEAIDNAEVVTGDQLSYDHIDLNFSGVFADLSVREAFLKTVPRQQILDAIITPLNPEAKIYDSQLFFPGTAAYDSAVAANGSADYADVDIEGAKTLLAGATPTVRIMYNTANPNRVDAFQAIQASAAEAGFIVEDGGLGAEAWGAALGSGTYDASIFGWISPGIGSGATTIAQIFATGGGGNYSGYSNADVDTLSGELNVSTTLEDQTSIQLEIENHVWADAYGLPLFVGPGVIAYNNAIDGVVYMPNQTGVVWNFWEWTLAG